MVQPEAAAEFLSDPVLRDQGFFSRMLLAPPDSIAGTRPFRDPTYDELAAIHDYGVRLLSILASPWPITADRDEGLRPKALTLSADAKRQWIDFYDDVERQSGPAGALRPVADLAAKIAEHACRIAGLLAVVERFDPIGYLDTDEIDGEAMAGGIVWRNGTWTRL